MTTGATLSLGGVTFPNYGTPDGNGVRWYYALDGWDGAPVRSEVLKVPNVRGGVAGEWVSEPRALVWHGLCWCPSEASMWATMDQIASLADVTGGDFTEWRVATPRNTLICQVMKAGQVLMNPRTDRVIEFSVPMTALDPLKYDATAKSVTATGSTTVTMAGTSKRSPLVNIVVTGTGGSGCSDWRYRNNTDGTGVLVYNHPIAAGEAVEFNFAFGFANSSTAGIVTPYLTSGSDWPELRRGANSVDMWTDSGTFSAVIGWRDGYA